MTKLGAVVLAAGKSERMGRNKFLLPWRGDLAGGKILHTLSQFGLSEIILVLGFDRDNILSCLGSTIEALRVKVAFNPHYEHGMLSSVKVGVKELRDDLDGFFLVLGDQPFLKAEWLARLKDMFSLPDTLAVVPTFRGKRGHPVLFSLKAKEEILSLDEGKDTLRTFLVKCRPSLREVEFSEEDILWDLDTPEEVEVYKTKIYGKGE